MLGKATIDKKSDSISKGKQGSMSNSFDRLGRELMLPDEVRKVDGTKCIVFIRGFNPIYDDKIDTFNHPLFKTSADVTKKYYVSNGVNAYDQSSQIQFLNEKALAYFEKENATIVDMSVAEFLDIDLNSSINVENVKMYFTPEELSKRRAFIEEQIQKDDKTIEVDINQDNVFDYLELKAAGYSVERLTDILSLLSKGYSREQIEEVIDVNSSDEYFNEVISLLLVE